MNVSPSDPFQIIYSLYRSEYLGYLFESFVVRTDNSGKLTLQHQNISAKNAKEFDAGLDKVDYELIALIDEINPDAIQRRFSKKSVKAADFLSKVFNKEKGNTTLAELIHRFLEDKRAQILSRLYGKSLFEMGNDADPTWRKIETLKKNATLTFHFKKESEQTTYYPDIVYAGKKISIANTNAYFICKEPAWFILDSRLYGFEHLVDGKKIIPFLTKEVVVIPKKLEDYYYRNFIAAIIESGEHIESEGFEIRRTTEEPKPILRLTELSSKNRRQLSKERESVAKEGHADEQGMMAFSLLFRYGKYQVDIDEKINSVTVEQSGDSYIFHHIIRNEAVENNFSKLLVNLGLPLAEMRCTLHKSGAFSWLNENRTNLLNAGVEISQPDQKDKKYFVGKAEISIEVMENIDWFDIHAIIRFGSFEIPFKDLRKLILRKNVEFKLPNGEFAIIPEAWLSKYGDLFAMSEVEAGKDKPAIRKHHLHVLHELQDNRLAKVAISERLKGFQDFNSVKKNYPAPEGFVGKLRSYQKAGYHWLRFLREFNLGGCLADDMGLGKTVQTLASLCAEKQLNKGGVSLLVMPTSLIYNWQQEAAQFSPCLNVLAYAGPNRRKDLQNLSAYDIVLTSYGIVRLDIDLLEKIKFNYCILDESQAIKNPSSNTAKSVARLSASHRLALTGTPLENSTLDLWSQMSFVNPGLLGTQAYFKKEYLYPIERKKDEHKLKKLNAIIKPFILRRIKSQVAADLPAKTESVYYTDMTPAQESRYEEAKSYYRTKILDQIDKEGISSSHMSILEGLTKLRQLANHPHMIDPAYKEDSGKMQDALCMIENALAEGHKLLIFSQFVKHLTLFREQLKKRGIAYAYLDGASANREQQVNKFNKTESLKIFLISIKAGGLGLNLTEADYVFILDPWWNPAVESQAIDRAHRIGQKRKVFAYRFITRNTVEEKILKLQQTKLQLSKSLVHTEESLIKNLTREDISMLMT